MARSTNRSNQPAVFREARESFHAALVKDGVLCVAAREIANERLPKEFLSNADGDSATSIAIAQGIFDQIHPRAKVANSLAGGTSGGNFQQITRSFLETSFSRLKTLGQDKRGLKARDAAITAAADSNCVIAPNVLILRQSDPGEVIKREQLLVDERGVLRSGIRGRHNKLAILHPAFLASGHCEMIVPRHSA
jgi:hypothetical protein